MFIFVIIVENLPMVYRISRVTGSFAGVRKITNLVKKVDENETTYNGKVKLW